MKKLKYIPELDSFRFWGLLMVLLHHWMPIQWMEWTNFGKASVDMFFLVSGYLITCILLQLKQDHQGWNRYKIFYARRFLRIFPIYYLVVIFTWLINKGYFTEALPWNLLYLSNFYMIKLETWPSTLSHLWSLSVEEQFYMVWPLLVFSIPKRWLLRFFLGAVALGFCTRLYFYVADYHHLYNYIFTLSCLDNLALGGVLAYLYSYHYDTYFKKILQQKWLFWIGVVIFVICAYCVMMHQYHFFPLVTFRTSTAIIFFFFTGWVILGSAWAKKWMRNRWIIRLGQLSYFMYLVHNFIPGIYMGMKFPESIYLRLIIYFVTLVIAAQISWYLIEMPINRLKSRFSYKSTVE